MGRKKHLTPVSTTKDMTNITCKVKSVSRRVKFDSNALSAKWWRRYGWKVGYCQSRRGNIRFDMFGADLVAFTPNFSPAVLIQACRCNSDCRRHIKEALEKGWPQAWTLDDPKPIRAFFIQAWKRAGGKTGVRKWINELYLYSPTQGEFVLQPEP